MKALVVVSLTVFGLVMSAPSFAGKGHKHAADGSHLPMNELTSEEVKTTGRMEIQRLVGKGKLGKNWQEATFVSAEKKNYNGKWEWLITYKNPSEKDPSKQTLFVFLTLHGGFVAANFTGK